MNKVTRNKNKDYTVISNLFFRDNNLSLKAKGLLAMVMSLPEDWDFSINGLESIIKEGKTSIYSAIDELKTYGYCKVETLRNEKGVITGNDYSFFENPYQENPRMENPNMDNQTQINTNNKQNKEKKEKELKESSISLFEECWKAYRRKGGKKKSLEQWKKLTDKEQSSVLSHIKAYVDSREMQFQKDFERYLRDKVFNDVVFAKNGYVAYDPSKGSTNEYNPHTDLTLMWNDYYKCYMYMGFYNGYIPDGYNDEDRPNGASVTLNNSRGIVVWNKEKKQWIKE